MNKDHPEEKMTEPEKDISSKSTKKSSGVLLIFGIAIILLCVIAGFLYWQNQSLKKQLIVQIIPTPAPSIAPAPTPAPVKPTGFVGYNIDGNIFMLDFPEECVYNQDGDEITIACINNGEEIIINLQAGGFGIEGYEPADMRNGSIYVNGYTWEYKIWIDTDGTAFAAYDLTDPNTNDYYLIHVAFDPYSDDGKEYFENILTTFRFMSDEETMCLGNEGTWINEYSECEYISENLCTENGGQYFECESACRHDIEETACTKQCVAVCEF